MITAIGAKRTKSERKANYGRINKELIQSFSGQCFVYPIHKNNEELVVEIIHCFYIFQHPFLRINCLLSLPAPWTPSPSMSPICRHCRSTSNHWCVDLCRHHLTNTVGKFLEYFTSFSILVHFLQGISDSKVSFKNYFKNKRSWFLVNYCKV